MRNYFTSMATVLMQASVQTRKDLEFLLQQMILFVISKPDVSHHNCRECVTTPRQWFAGSKSRI